MRARKTSEYEKDGKMLGKHKDTMSQMFDTRGDQGSEQRNELFKSLETSKTDYDRQLHSDWIIKVYDKCRLDCLLRPAMFKFQKAETSVQLNENMQADNSEID